MRLNRYRQKNGHVFQGRYKSVAFEGGEGLGWLCHYIHLNPARAGICSALGFRSYGLSSYRHLWDKRKRPRCLSFEACLEAAGNLRDTPAGRVKYAQYLEWLAEDEPRQKRMLFKRMSKGWAIGSDGFRRALLEDEKALKACLGLAWTRRRGCGRRRGQRRWGVAWRSWAGARRTRPATLSPPTGRWRRPLG